jgi:hypothetical protein
MTATGLIAANSDWAVTGWCLLGAVAVLVGAMSFRKTRKARSG